MGDTLGSQTVSTKLQRIAEQAENYPEMVFNNLSHLIDLDFLEEAYRQTNKRSGAGVDKVTAKEYAENLVPNLKDLHQRLKDNRYVAPPVERVWIDKEGGKKRPIGKPCFEDKIVQRAVVMITVMVRFKRPLVNDSPQEVNSTFGFLGFTHYWTKSLRGYWVIKCKTIGKRLRRFMKAMWQWCRDNRHEPLKEQYSTLCSKLRGYYQYYGVRRNYKALETAFEYTLKAWRYWLSRRCHKGYINLEKFAKSILSEYALPKPRIVHTL